jgi:hypothetical protein
MAMHALVVQRFPNTPWVYGGAWSWFSDRFRLLPDVVVYPYLPLVLIDKERITVDRLREVYEACGRYGVRCVDVGDGESRLMSVLDELEESAGG